MTKEPENVYWGICNLGNRTFRLAATKAGLCCITLPNESFEALERWAQKHMGSSILVKDETLLSEYIQQLKAYFESRRKAFTFPLDLRGTPFQIQVWKALLDIPYGTTKSYSEIAKAINRPLAVRAVGAANAANPIPVVIPCHRVIGKNGTLTGYRGGLDLKAELLRLEGIT
ncbi:methylated-DNA--[protein]-cysteine S-methyltransferase [Polycladomyces zharkentensis]|nr:methylated-DNA--[protein]-cysteine S-methyltransferase [Polycladomyces sp. WAk]